MAALLLCTLILAGTGAISSRAESVMIGVGGSTAAVQTEDETETPEISGQSPESTAEALEYIPEAGESVTEAFSEGTAEEASEAASARARQILEGMTTGEKVSQLFWIAPESLTGVGTVTAAGETTRACFDRYPVGGIVYFSANIVSREQLTDMLQSMQEISRQRLGVDIFLAVDEEGGRISRLYGSGVSDIPYVAPMAEIGATGDTQQAYETGVTIGSYLSELGFNADFAPDADVLSNPDNTVIGDRSFGSDPELAASMVAAEIQGLHEAGIRTAAKHFPGHGATGEDSHQGAAVYPGTPEDLWACDLIPFRAAIEAGTDLVMVGHISLPNVTGDYVPASLSESVISGLLRTDLGYDGLVVTDALNMGAVTNLYTSSQAAVQTILAGGDMILMPADFASAWQGVYDAVENGTISGERLDESVLRILTAKLS